MAEKEGFEPSRRYQRPTPFPGEPLQPLGYFSIVFSTTNSRSTERLGFEPREVLPSPVFKTGALNQLDHLSIFSVEPTYKSYTIKRLLSIFIFCFSFKYCLATSAYLIYHSICHRSTLFYIFYWFFILLFFPLYIVHHYFYFILLIMLLL